jgi:hypothetical protein
MDKQSEQATPRHTSSPMDEIEVEDHYRHTRVSEVTGKVYRRRDVRRAFETDDHNGFDRFTIRPLD